MRFFKYFSLFFLILTSALCAKTVFPELTGRVVDAAHILSPNTISTLIEELGSFEQETTDQIVVITVPSLEGQAIETYGYQLGRFWGIGQKDKNNGAMLIVAPKEHKVRIEVGYGLEGVLTDAEASQIIEGGILPRFKAGDMNGGVLFGAEAIIRVLKGQPMNAPQNNILLNNNPNQLTSGPLAGGTPNGGLSNIIGLLIVLFIFFIRFGIFFFPFGRHMGSGFTSSGLGGGGFGGFSGGGGSFGGGGASGSW